MHTQFPTIIHADTIASGKKNPVDALVSIFENISG